MANQNQLLYFLNWINETFILTFESSLVKIFYVYICSLIALFFYFLCHKTSLCVFIDRKYIGIQNRTQFENKWLTDAFWKNAGIFYLQA